jgi:hypothetical protein
MVNAAYDVKLIDFDSSSFEGKKVAAAGNFDFCSNEIKIAIERNKKITASKKYDTYPLSLCCLLLLADNERIYFRSLSEEIPLNDS